MAKLEVILSIFALSVSALTAQQELAGARATRTVDGNLTVSSDESRPLRFALLALAETYGWTVDYEDPVYSGSEISDTTDAQWLKEHPNGRHVYAPAKGSFSADLGKVVDGNPDEMQLVSALTVLYDRTSNPGTFQVVRTANGRLAVVGQSRHQPAGAFTPVLNQQMRPPQKSESASKALQELASECSVAAGVPIELGILPSNATATSTVSGYDGMLTCREQLGRILAALDHPTEYLLLYDINTRAYYLNIAPARQLVVGPGGKLTTVPLDNRN